MLAALKRTAWPPVRETYKKLRSALVVDNNGDWRKSVFLSGGERTGSTWVAELINYNNEYRFLYEPFFIQPPGYPDIYKTLPDNRIQYIRPDFIDSSYLAHAEFILSGRFKHPHVDMYTPRLRCDKRLIKEVKANGWVKWLKNNFPDLPILVLLRHPVPTARSRYQGYFNSTVERRQEIDAAYSQLRCERYLTLVFGQKDLVEDHLEPLRAGLEAAQTVMEQRVAVWCIENYVPLRQFAAGEICLTFYENYCVAPEDEIRRVDAFLGRTTDEAHLDRFMAKLRKPSANSHLKAEMKDGWKMVSSWQSKATEDELRQADRILKLFGLDAVYSAFDPLPNVAAAYAALERNASAAHLAGRADGQAARPA